MSNDQSQMARFLIVAGEPSGDQHAASLVGALRQAARDRSFEFFGSTGVQMRAAGVESIVKADELAILGLWEIGRALPKFWRAFADLKRAVEERPPDAAILVDWPDFNLRLARWLHRRGTRVIYYISPQLWAWRPYRARNIQRDVDLLLSILPFEKDWYAERGIRNVEYVGHPLTGEVKPQFGRDEFCRRHDLDPVLPVIAFLPGSRHKEMVRILPPMLESIALLHSERPNLQFVIVVAPNRQLSEPEAMAASYLNQEGLRLCLVQNETREALAAAHVAAIASGTATLEAALLGTPMVIVYKESAMNWHTLGSLITAEHYGLANLFAGWRLATELIQDHFTPPRLAEEIGRLLDPAANRSMREQLGEVTRNIGAPGASDRAAQAILSFLDNRRAVS